MMSGQSEDIMNERIVCLDIGDARIGVAVSDASRLIATPIDTIYRVGWGPDVKKIVAICEQYETNLVLSGWPLNMDGTSGFQSEKVKKFCEQLEKAGLTVYYQDERLTTVTATNALIEGNMHRAERKHNVDKVAAAVILQQWLDTQRNAAEEQYEQQEEKTMENNENLEIIELIDESGETVQFRLLAGIEYEGAQFLAVTDDLSDDEDGECSVFIMLVSGEGEDVIYEMVEDEAVQQAVFTKFLQIMDEEDAENE
ncbi:MAG: Holliday junction resolvase RuvX [Clostridia bacterium]|nr:Holliday junction resolvase RuvX [Clostridia bacterium]